MRWTLGSVDPSTTPSSKVVGACWFFGGNYKKQRREDKVGYARASEWIFEPL